MPQFLLGIPNAEETISSPIIYGITTRILRTLKFYKDEHINIIFLNNSGVAVNKGSDLDTGKIDRSQNRLPTDAMIKVEVDERYNENMSRSTAFLEGAEKSIFRCEKTKTVMSPGYQQMIATININFRFPTRHAAESFRRSAREAAVRSVDGIKIQSKYNYIIPYAFLNLLDHIYTLMENKHGYGISLGDWLRESFNSQLTTLANQSGGQTTLAIAEQQQGVLILFQDFDDTPRKEKENDQDAWSVNLSFEAYYDRPDLMRISYQHVINNQPVDMMYTSRFRVQKQDYLNTKTNIALYGANQVGDTPPGSNYLSGASSPIFDDWLPSHLTQYFPDAIRAMIILNENDLQDVIDLTDIADWELGESTLNWLRATHTTIGKKWFNVFYIQLWEWDYSRSSELITMDADLKVRFAEDLDPRKNYHVTLGLCNDPTKLDPSVWDLLGQHPDFFKDYLSVISPELVDWTYAKIIEYWENWRNTDTNPWGSDDSNDPNKPQPGDWGNVPPKVIEDLKDYLDEWYRQNGLQKMQMKTVMFSSIYAKKKAR